MITFSLLASLQAVNLFWLYLIVRIAKNYVFNSGLADERSDDEEENEEGEQQFIDDKSSKKILEKKTDMATDSPVVLVNGKPIEADAASTGADGIKQRKKR